MRIAAGRQLPFDINLVPRQNPSMRGESESQVSLTRAAMTTAGGARRKLLLVVSSVLWLCLPVAGLASTRVVAWGAGAFSASTPNFGQCMVPSDLTNAIAIAAGCFHSLALKADGTVVAWLGNNSEDYGQSTVPAGLSNVVAIAAGGYHTLALVGEGPPVLRAPMATPTAGTGGFSVSLPSQSGRV
jgi:hypothetical protein